MRGGERRGRLDHGPLHHGAVRHHGQEVLLDRDLDLEVGAGGRAVDRAEAYGGTGGIVDVDAALSARRDVDHRVVVAAAVERADRKEDPLPDRKCAGEARRQVEVAVGLRQRVGGRRGERRRRRGERRGDVHAGLVSIVPAENGHLEEPADVDQADGGRVAGGHGGEAGRAQGRHGAQQRGHGDEAGLVGGIAVHRRVGGPVRHPDDAGRAVRLSGRDRRLDQVGADVPAVVDPPVQEDDVAGRVQADILVPPARAVGIPGGAGGDGAVMGTRVGELSHGGAGDGVVLEREAHAGILVLHRPHQRVPQAVGEVHAVRGAHSSGAGGAVAGDTDLHRLAGLGLGDRLFELQRRDDAVRRRTRRRQHRCGRRRGQRRIGQDHGGEADKQDAAAHRFARGPWPGVRTQAAAPTCVIIVTISL